MECSHMLRMLRNVAYYDSKYTAVNLNKSNAHLVYYAVIHLSVLSILHT